MAPAAGGTTRAASVEELDVAVREATTALLETRAVLAGHVAVYGDTVWFSGWVRFVDGDTFEHVAFNPGSSEPSSDGAFETHATVAVAGEVVRGASDSDGKWQAVAAEPGNPLPVDLDAMAAGLDLGGSSGVEATVRETADGTRVWTLQEGSGFSRRWVVSADGHLLAFALKRPTPPGSVGEETLEPPPLTSAEVRFTVGQDDPSIPLPDVGSPLEIDRFEVWEDLPRPGDPA